MLSISQLGISHRPRNFEQKESKRLPLSGLKAGIASHFILMGDARDYSQNLYYTHMLYFFASVI